LKRLTAAILAGGGADGVFIAVSRWLLAECVRRLKRIAAKLDSVKYLNCAPGSDFGVLGRRLRKISQSLDFSAE
jgi:hypothetical protein